MQGLLTVSYKLAKGLYLCTFGYFKGDYNPTLYKEWKESKIKLDEEVNKADEFDYLLAKASSHLEEGGVSYTNRKEQFQALKNVSFKERGNASFYSKNNLESFWMEQVQNNFSLRLDKMDELFYKGLTRLIPKLNDYDRSKSSEIELPGMIIRTRSEDYQNKEKLFNLSDYVENPEDRVDTFMWMLEGLMYHQQEDLNKGLETKVNEVSSVDISHTIPALQREISVKGHGARVFQKILNLLPETKRAELATHNVSTNDYSYYFMLRSYWLTSPKDNQQTPEENSHSLKYYNQDLVNAKPEQVKFADLNLKPIFTRFEHEYISQLYGKHCSMPNMPQGAEQMGAFVKKMEFITSLGFIGAFFRLPADCIDFLANLWF